MEYNQPPANVQRQNSNKKYVLLFIVIVCFLLGGIVGYISNVNNAHCAINQQESNPSPKPVAVTVIPQKVEYDSSSLIQGKVTTQVSSLYGIAIFLRKWENGKMIEEEYDVREFIKPQVGVGYTYAFKHLNPTTPYIVYAIACTTSECSGKLEPVYCSGNLDADKSGCVTNVPGRTDFTVIEKIEDVPVEKSVNILPIFSELSDILPTPTAPQK